MQQAFVTGCKAFVSFLVFFCTSLHLKQTRSHAVLCVILLSAKDSFSPKMFFKTVGLSKKTPAEIERVFKILDQDKSGYIEQDELQLSWKHKTCPVNKCLHFCVICVSG